MLTQTEQAPKTYKRPNKSRIILVVLGFAFPVLAHVLISSSLNQLVAAILLTLAALLFWSIHAMPIGWVSGLVLAIALALHLLPLNSVWPTVSSPPIIIILAGFVLAEAVRRTGLASYVADKVLQGSRSPRGVVLKMAFYELLAAFVIPNVAVRVTLIIPILRALALSPKTRRLLIIDAGMTSIMTGSLTLMSSSSAISSEAIVHHLFGVEWSFFDWLRIFGPAVLVLWCVAQLIIISQITSEPKMIKTNLHRPKLTWQQKRTVYVLGLMLFGWITGPLARISLVYVSITGVALLVLPRYGVISAREAVRSLRLDLAVFYVVSLSLPIVLTNSGVAKFITDIVTAKIHPNSDLLLYASLTVTIITMRLLFANSVTLTAIFLPILATLKSTWHINGLVASIILIFAGSFGFLLPAQSPAGVIAAEFGKISSKEFLKIGIPVAVCGIGIVMVASLVYWPSVV